MHIKIILMMWANLVWVLVLIFVVLKLTNTLTISWLYALSPMWVMVNLGSLLYVICCCTISVINRREKIIEPSD